MPIVDYFIAFPLLQEWESSRGILVDHHDAMTPVPRGALTYWTWKQTINAQQHYSGDYLVVGTPLSLWTPGSATTGSAVTTLLREWPPQTLIVSGIAGSIEPDTVKLGDVVVAPKIHGYEISAMTDTGEELRGTSHRPGAIHLNRVAMFRQYPSAYKRWQADGLKHAQDLGLSVSRPPTLHLGEIASGNRVVRSAAFGRVLKDKLSSDIVAVEMEAVAAHQAAHMDAKGVEPLIVRGISDYADEEKSKLEVASKDGWRILAAANAARFIRALMELGTVEPISPPYQLDMTAGPIPPPQRLIPGPAAIGTQNLRFQTLLARRHPSSELRIQVRAKETSGNYATAFLGVANYQSQAEHKMISGEFKSAGVLEFILPPTDWGLTLELQVRFHVPVDEIEITCNDTFGRTTTGSMITGQNPKP